VLHNYMQELADKYNLYGKMRFEHRVKRTVWIEVKSQWEVTVEDLKRGREFTNKHYGLCESSSMKEKFGSVKRFT
jgi:cation diffusion facilitator CzcD-associated flavoprotein CzcO